MLNPPKDYKTYTAYDLSQEYMAEVAQQELKNLVKMAVTFASFRLDLAEMNLERHENDYLFTGHVKVDGGQLPDIGFRYLVSASSMTTVADMSRALEGLIYFLRGKLSPKDAS